MIGFFKELFAEAELALSLFVLVMVFLGFLFEKLPPAAVATAGAAAFLLMGYISTKEALEVFSNPAPITIAAMFILSSGLVATGVLDAASNYFVRLAERRGFIAIILLFLGAAFASGIMNNTPLVIVLIPIVIKMAQTLKVASSKLLMPLSYMCILGGTLTLIGTSTNLLIDGVAQQSGMEPLRLLEILPFGLVALVAGGATLALLGRYLLPNREGVAGALDDGDTLFMSELRVKYSAEKDDLPEKFRSLSDFSSLAKIKITGIIRGSKRLNPTPDFLIEPNDYIIFKSSRAEIVTLHSHPNYDLGYYKLAIEAENQEELTQVEAIYAGDVRSQGTRMRDFDWFGAGARVLGVSRRNHNPGPEIAEIKLRSGDRVLLEGSPADISKIFGEGEFVTAAKSTARPYRRHRAPLAIAAIFIVILLSVFDFAPIVTLSLLGVGFVLLAGCVDADEAWGSIDGSTLVLIFGMLAIGKGLENTGLVESFVQTLLPYISNASPLIILFAVYALTSFLTEIVSNNAVAVILTPLVISVATSLGVDPRPLIYAIMLGASASFATPIGYQTNTLVYAAGNYRFTDFLKIGVVMNIVVGIASCIAIWLITGV